jgi:hypothetical protein
MGKYALIIVAALIFSVITYSHALRNAIFISNTRVIQSYSQNQAHNIAQSAAMIAINSIRNDQNSNLLPNIDQVVEFPTAAQFMNWPQLQGGYQLLINNQGDSLVTISSTGRFEETIYTVNVGLQPISGGTFNWPVPNLDQAVHADDNITLTGSSQILGDASVNASTPNSVSLQWSTLINGSLSIGGGDPEQVVNQANFQNGNVAGSVFVGGEKNYPMPEFPEIPSPGNPGYHITGPIDITGGPANNQTIDLTNSGDLYIPYINIQSNRELTLIIGDGNRTLHVGNMNVHQGHINVIVNGDGRLNFLVENEFRMGGDSSINHNQNNSDPANNRNPRNVMLFYNGTNNLTQGWGNAPLGGNIRLNADLFIKEADLNISGSSAINGHVISGGDNISITGDASAISRVVYAPNANVTLTGSGRVRGSVVAKTFTGTGNIRVFYDDGFIDELPELDSGDGGMNEFNISFWN